MKRKFDLSTLKSFAKKEHQRLQKYYNLSDRKQLNLPITVKIMEELGELCNEVLANSGLQRKEKLEKMQKDNLAEEFADVILTACILAENMGVDIEKGVKKKMEKIEKRYK
ncbi:hypothetical protein HYX13_00280 [Candidatus Woesearchaeota archaeon]|nr:hypothetical protein [Candidatus Woesearchaeota archaeon]